MRSLAVVLAVLVLAPAPAQPCATAPPAGEEVRIADEEAVIVWDAANKTETFIRRARFASTAQKFGFLVPTPTKPELGEAADGIFSDLAERIRPGIQIDESGVKLEVTTAFQSCLAGMEKSAPHQPAPAVRVIQTAHVAGMDATTVEADDPKALADWLGAHGFAATPQLTAWLAPYVASHWKLTAFVIASDAQAGQVDVATKAVKMTFAADQPFYPYREPEEPQAKDLVLPPRMLRVFFISDQRYTGKLGAAPWSASTLYSAATALPPALGTWNRRLTVFIDEAPVRPAADELTFVANADQTEVKPPPVIVHRPKRIPIPLDVIAFFGLVAGLIVWKRRKR